MRKSMLIELWPGKSYLKKWRGSRFWDFKERELIVNNCK
jgi:hypothetical protein